MGWHLALNNLSQFVVYDSQSTMPWASAYIWQAQTLAELTARDALSNGRNALEGDVERVQWHGSLVRD